MKSETPYQGPDAAAVKARDQSVCECGHKCVSHGSQLADGAWAPRIGGGMCGIESLPGRERCRCNEFTETPLS